MVLRILLSYTIVLLTLVLAVGVINIYYLLDFVLQKGNREKLYKVWFLLLFALAVKSVAHLTEVIAKTSIIYQVLELSSLLIGLAAMLILTKDTMTHFAFVETQKGLEAEITKRTKSLKNEIAERKQVESNLRKSEEKFRNLAEHSPNMIFINRRGHVEYANKKCEEVMGYSREELYSKDFNLMTIIAPESRKLIKENMKLHMRGEEVAPYEYTLLTKEGREIIGIHTTTLIDYEGGKAILGIVTDITDKKEAEIALRMSEEKYRSIFENSPLGIFHYDKNGVITASNENFIKLLGTSKEKLIGFNMVTSLKNEKMKAAVAAPLSGNPGRFEGEYLSVTGGKLAKVKADFSPILSEDGSVLGAIGIIEDIAERKKTEDRLLYFQKAVEGASDAIGMSTPEGRHYYQNEAFTRLFGLSVKEVDGKSGPPATVYVDENVGREVFDTIMRGDSWSGEVEMLNKAGQKMTIFLRAYAMKNEKGKITGLVGVHTDITERKQIEEELKKSETRLRTIINLEPECVKLVALDGTLLEMNPAGLKMVGAKSSEEVCGRSVYDLILPEDLDDFRALHDSACQGVTGSAEFRIVGLDNQERHVESTSVPWRDAEGNIVAVLSVTRDITERKHAREALRESEEKYSTIVEKGNDGIAIVQEGLIQFVNNKLTEIAGYSKEEVIGKPFIDLLPLEYRELVAERYKKRLKGEEPPNIYEIEITSKEGKTIPIEINASRIEYKGKPADMAVIRDITERKRVEKLIKDVNKNLELKVRERTAEVEEQKEKLTAANEELTAMNEELSATQDELNEVNKTLEKKVEERTKQWRLSETVSTSLGRVIEESLNEIFVFNSKTLKFINVNKGARENLGYTLEELQNLTPLDIKPEFTLQSFSELIQPLLTGKQNSLVFTTIHKRKDSSTYDAEVHLQLSTFGEQKAFVAIVLDITERKQAEEKLHEKISELESWQRLTVGREVRMVELKAEIEELKARLKKYETF